ncbi:MAG: NAD(P)H-binding protein, partial [Acidimicrobiia bacterium]|nr:NAD(P)H-binding protein [Acidimicrobiia bacterium]
MKVFVTGGTGVLGRRVVALLVNRGDDVTALARSPERAATLARAGATPVVGSLFDGADLAGTVPGHEAVCSLATSIPSTSRSVLPGAWNENTRIRTEGSRLLVDAAASAGVERFVQESIAFTYADGGDHWLDEDAAVDPVPLTAGALVAEEQARRLPGGVALRFGQLYAPDASHTVDAVRGARRGWAMLLGGPG